MEICKSLLHCTNVSKQSQHDINKYIRCAYRAIISLKLFDTCQKWSNYLSIIHSYFIILHMYNMYNCMQCCKVKEGYLFQKFFLHFQEHAFESSQKYKEGKFIIELAHMIKDNGWAWLGWQTNRQCSWILTVFYWPLQSVMCSTL